MTSAEQDQGDNATTTYVTLAVVRNFTDYTDDRVPASLPADPEQRSLVLVQLDAVAGEYAERAYKEIVIGTGASRGLALLHAHTLATTATRSVRYWAKRGGSACAPADGPVKRVMLAILLWKMATALGDEALEHAAHATAVAAFAAGERMALALQAPGGQPELEAARRADQQSSLIRPAMQRK